MTTERTESQGFFEMLWDCDHCGTKGLLGKSQRHCANCGAPQNPDKRYYPTPEQQQQVQGHEYVGSDRTCPACSSPMSAKAKNCTQCGSPLDGSKEVRGVDEPAVPGPRKRSHRIWLYVAIAVAVVAFAIWFIFIRKYSAQVQIAAHHWERTITIEQFGDQHREGWRDELPAGAEMPLCSRRQRSSRQVQDGEDCHVERHDKKDGTFEQVKKCKPKYRSEPVEDDWCTYTIRAWGKVDEARATGTGLTAGWPAVAGLTADAPAVLGARRQGKRDEKLVLDFGDAGSCDVDETTWRKYADGQKVNVEVRSRSGEVVCSSL